MSTKTENARLWAGHISLISLCMSDFLKYPSEIIRHPMTSTDILKQPPYISQISDVENECLSYKLFFIVFMYKLS